MPVGTDNSENLYKIFGDMDKLSNKCSQYPDGHVPNIYWNVENRKLCIFDYSPRNCNDNLRSRAEVSTTGALASLLYKFNPTICHLRDIL